MSTRAAKVADGYWLKKANTKINRISLATMSNMIEFFEYLRKSELKIKNPLACFFNAFGNLLIEGNLQNFVQVQADFWILCDLLHLRN